MKHHEEQVNFGTVGNFGWHEVDTMPGYEVSIAVIFRSYLVYELYLNCAFRVPKSFNGKPLIPQRVVQRRGDFSRSMGHGMSKKLHPNNRQGVAIKDVEEFESARATEEKRDQ